MIHGTLSIKCQPPRSTRRPASALGLVLCLLFGSAGAQDLGVCPIPQEITWDQGQFVVDQSTPILIAADAPAGVKFAANDLRQALQERAGLSLGVVELPAGAGAPARGGILMGRPSTNPPLAERLTALGLKFDEAMRPEGYLLAVTPNGIVLGAESDRGILYATMSLRQMLLARSAGTPLPAARVRDWPAMKLRGIHDEISYGQVSTMDNFKDMIRFLAEFKMNTLVIYFEDTFQFKKYPAIGVGRGALSPAQIEELEAFAKPLGVEIFPVFEMLGNQGALLMLDETRHLAEYPGAHSFAIGEDVYQFLADCFNEMADVFDSKYFHAGLDESWDLGYGRTEERVRREGRSPVHAAHYRRLNDMLRSRGKTMIMYGDVILKWPEILDLIPKDIILMDWQYEAQEHYPTVEVLAKPGFPLLVLPGMSNWDRIFPDYAQALINIKNFTLDCYKHSNCLGSITSTWGDNGSKNLRELLYAGYAYGAEVTWTPQSTDVGDFHRRFFTLWNGPGTAPYFESIYALLGKWPWWFPMLDYFRHPFLPRKDEKPHLEKDLARVGEDARVARLLCEELAPKLKRRKGDVDYLRYCARMHENYIAGQLLVRDLRAFDPSALSTPAIAAAKARFLARINSVRDEVTALRDLFQELWLRTNIDANLHYAIAEYNMMIKAWDEAAQRVQADIFAFDPRPPAHWIYHPDGFAQGKHVQDAYFRKTFDIHKSDIVRAGLQLQGDTHIKVFVNGYQVGEQFVRRNLSCPVNPRLLVVYDILPQLVDGKNVIAVEAHNYGTENAELEPGGPARCGGFHLYGEVVDRAGVKHALASDASWRVLARPLPDWNLVSVDDRRWRAAKADPHPTVWVTYPDFENGLRGFSDRR